MGKQWVDAKKPAVSPKFSLANRAAMEIFGVCWVFFFGKWRVTKEVQTVSENGNKTRNASTEQLSL